MWRTSKPIYGLIFLFRWREDDAHKQEASCPDGIWFANQVQSTFEAAPSSRRSELGRAWVSL